MKKNYYVVFYPWEIRKIYSSWDTCKAALNTMKGVPRNFLGVRNKAEAIFALKECRNSQEFKENYKKVLWASADLPRRFLAVDAAFSSATGQTEYQGVMCPELTIAFKCGPYQGGSNNIGEFLAIVDGFRYLDRIGESSLPIYSDSQTGISWVRNGSPRSTVDISSSVLGVVVRDAQKWIRGHNIDLYSLSKWNTSEYGEIPADFGRK